MHSLFAILAADPSQTHSPFWPEKAELMFGVPAAVIVLYAVFRFGGPVAKKGLAARTQRIQDELDSSAGDLSSATAEAEQIRQAKGDIEAERARILAEADTQAELVLTEGRKRVAAEVADLEAKADADIATAAGRASDELRAEIARLSGQIIDRVAESTIDSSLQNELVESFIAKVGASA